MKYVLKENRLKQVFENYMDSITSELIRKTRSDLYKTMVWEFPNVAEYDMSFFDYEPDWALYEYEDIPSVDVETVFWIRCDTLMELKIFFGISERQVFEFVKNWAENKYDIKISRVTCQG